MSEKDYTSNYFEYKIVRCITVFLVVFLIGIISLILIVGYVDRMNKGLDNEYTVQMKYLQMGYIQRSCGKCSTTWAKPSDTLKCSIDGTECK